MLFLETLQILNDTFWKCKTIMNFKYGFENNSEELYLKFDFSVYCLFTVKRMATKWYEIKFQSLTYLKGSFQSIKITHGGKRSRDDVLNVFSEVL